MQLKSLLIALGLGLLLSAKALAAADDIIPRPLEVKALPGEFKLTPQTTIAIDRDAQRPTAQQLAAQLDKPLGTDLQIKTLGDPAGAITLTFDGADVSLGDEGYQLTVHPDAVVIRANSDAGLFYGIQSLRQLLPPEIEKHEKVDGMVWSIPCVEIKDSPRYAWRGMMLDVSRHFYDKGEVEHVLDLMALHKLNRFHWHLTDDQGWRIEIKKYPKLTEIGAWRDGIGFKLDPRRSTHFREDGKYGGFYTQDEIREVVAYAAKLHIMVIPEIEMPGHAQAALAAYPQFSCTKKALDVGVKAGVMDAIYDAGDDSVFGFLDDVLTEVSGLFPAPFIHIGGDEVPKGPWKKTESCQTRIKALGLKNEEELQSYFIKRVEKIVEGKNRRLIGWDEILEGGLAPGATVMSWRGIDGGIAAAKAGHDVIMTPTSNCYIDYSQTRRKGEPPTGGNYLPLEKVYSYEPTPESLSDEEGKHILGAQGNLWTEYVPNMKQVEYQAFPRETAMAEVGWSSKEHKDFSDFHRRLEVLEKRLAVMGVNYFQESPPATGPSIMPHRFEVGSDAFLLDGKPFQIISGEMHYSRIPPEYWIQRIAMARAMGLNTITIYCFWNIQEPEPGQWNWQGFGDVVRFCKLAQEAGLYVIVRPGPYICGEWDFGGYPAWLLRTPAMKVRSMEENYIKAADSYVHHMAEQLAPLQISKGGPIILWQVENEYGSYGRDKQYLAHLRDEWKKAGIEVPLFTADGGGRMMADGSIDGVLPGLNGGDANNTAEEVGKYRPHGPYLVPEFYPGWLDHWAERHQTRNADAVADSFKKLLDKNISVNLYMFHGGTNWDGMAGANFGGHYQPQPTSYDYDAPLDEAGRPTPKYFLLRKVIADRIGGDAKIPPVPATNPVIAIAPIALKESVSLFDTLPKPIESEKPLTMEAMNQNYGYVLYRKEINNVAGVHKLTLHGLNDYAQIFVDGRAAGVLDSRLRQESVDVTFPAGPAQLDILVTDDGRVNYGREILENHKGITDRVTLGDETITGWQCFSIPLATVEKLSFGKAVTSLPAYLHGTFQLTEVGDTFLDLRGWTKGWVWVNGHNLGRYWFIGPQQTLYLPGCWLKKGDNSIVVLEQEKLPETVTVAGVTTPVLDQLVKLKSAAPKINRWKKAPSLRDDALVAVGEFADGNQKQVIKFFGPKTGRYLVLEALSSQKGDPYANAAEIGALDDKGKSLSRDRWAVAYADSEENISEDGNADNVLDGDGETLWHTQYDGGQPPYPHMIVIDLGEMKTVGAMVYTPRPTDSPGRIKGYKVYLLTDSPQ